MQASAFAAAGGIALVGTIALIAPAPGSQNSQNAPPSASPTPALASIPVGYRDWRVITVAHEAGELNDIRAVLGNDIAINTYREGKSTFPDGAIIARLAWRYEPSEENNKTFGREQSFVAGPPVNGLQFMIKDSKKFASTGGWGFAQFDDGKPLTDAAKLHSCFTCHALIQDRDLVFARYSP